MCLRVAGEQLVSVVNTPWRRKIRSSPAYRVAVLFNYVLCRGSAAQVPIWWYYPVPPTLRLSYRLDSF